MAMMPINFRVTVDDQASARILYDGARLIALLRGDKVPFTIDEVSLCRKCQHINYKGTSKPCEHMHAV